MNFYLTDSNGLRVITHQPRREDRVIAVCSSVDAAFNELRQVQAQRDIVRARWQIARDIFLGLMLVALMGFGGDIVGEERMQARIER